VSRLIGRTLGSNVPVQARLLTRSTNEDPISRRTVRIQAFTYS
jgi:hypothetical protein